VIVPCTIEPFLSSTVTVSLFNFIKNLRCPKCRFARALPTFEMVRVYSRTSIFTFTYRTSFILRIPRVKHAKVVQDKVWLSHYSGIDANSQRGESLNLYQLSIPNLHSQTNNQGRTTLRRNHRSSNGLYDIVTGDISIYAKRTKPDEVSSKQSL